VLRITQADTNHQAISASARSQYRRTSLVHSCLDYCNVVFAGLPLPASNLQRMQSVFNAAVQLVTNTSKRDRTTPLLRDRHWLPIKQRIDDKLCMMVHRYLHERTLSYFVEIITPSAATHSRAGLKWAELGTVTVPRTYSSLGDRAFAVAAPRARNNLPLSIRVTVSSDCFTRNLETFLYNAALIP